MTLEASLVADIRAHGPISFGRYMERALYDPELGYYARDPDRVGWEGHFVTAPALGHSFGELWAEFFLRAWAACGRPERFEIVEVGPGDGAFAAALLDAVAPDMAEALTYRLVEPRPRSRRRQRAALGARAETQWSSSLDEVARVAAGCVFANEVLDNLPVELVEGSDEGLKQAFVDLGRDGLTLVWRDAGPEVAAFFERDVPPGVRAEASLESLRFARRAARIIERGAVVLIDYGDESEGLLRRPHGTLVCYSESGADALPLERPGHKDITSHANWTGVRKALEAEDMRVLGPLTQRAALRELGLDALHERLRAESAGGDPVGRVRALSRRQALGIAADPSGMGGFGVLVGGRGLDPEALLPGR